MQCILCNMISKTGQFHWKWKKDTCSQWDVVVLMNVYNTTDRACDDWRSFKNYKKYEETVYNYQKESTESLGTHNEERFEEFNFHTTWNSWKAEETNVADKFEPMARGRNTT